MASLGARSRVLLAGILAVALARTVHAEVRVTGRSDAVTVELRDVPWVNRNHRVVSERLAGDCWRITARYGFMERPDVAHALELCAPGGLQLDPMQVTYFLSREKIVPGTSARGAARWCDRVFAAMARNAGSISDYFNIPTNRVVELGTRVEL